MRVYCLSICFPEKNFITLNLLICHDKLHGAMRMRAYCRGPIVVMLALHIFRITLSIVYTLRMHLRMSSVTI